MGGRKQLSKLPPPFPRPASEPPAGNVVEPARGDIEAKTVSNPPRPPTLPLVIVAGGKTRNEATSLVTPLVVKLERAERGSDRRWRWIGGGLVAVAVAAAVIASKGADSLPRATESAASAQAPAPVEPPPPAVETPAPEVKLPADQEVTIEVE